MYVCGLEQSDVCNVFVECFDQLIQDPSLICGSEGKCGCYAGEDVMRLMFLDLVSATYTNMLHKAV